VHAVADSTADPALTVSQVSGQLADPFGRSPGPTQQAVTAAELLYGVAWMPAGRRKTELAAAVRGLLGDEFRDRVLPFDEHCASRYADIVCGRETLGRPIGVADAQIAAICRTAEATLATRNTDDFSGTGIELINPWKLDRPGPA
jgi:predicted nucleic acid-binding protein